MIIEKPLIDRPDDIEMSNFGAYVLVIKKTKHKVLLNYLLPISYTVFLNIQT